MAFRIPAGLAAGELSRSCDTLRLDCRSLSFRVGAQIHYAIAPDDFLNPWLGYGLGYSSVTVGDDGADVTYRGFDFGHFMAGLDLDIPVGGGDPIPSAKDGAKTKSKGYVELGVGVGFGVGTDRQIDPPLDNSEVGDKGFLLEGKLGAGFNLGSALSLGVVVPVTAGYYFVQGEDSSANEVDTQYQGVEAALLVNLRLKIKVK